MKIFFKKILYKLKIIRIIHTEVIDYNKITNNKNKVEFYSNDLKKDIVINFKDIKNNDSYLKKNTTPLFSVEKLFWFNPVNKMIIVLPKTLSEEELDAIWEKSNKEIEHLLDGAVD
jgi:hypothetical protein